MSVINTIAWVLIGLWVATFVWLGLLIIVHYVLAPIERKVKVRKFNKTLSGILEDANANRK